MARPAPAPVAVTARTPPAAPAAGGSRGITGRRVLRPKLRACQVVCWQLAIGLVVATAGRAWWVTVAAAAVALLLVALTTTWRRDLWMYQRAILGLRYLVSNPRFVAVEAVRGSLEIGDSEAGVMVRPSGLTVLLEVRATLANLPDPSELLEQQNELQAKLVLQRGHCWIALTAGRTAHNHRDAELELLLANATRRLVKRLQRAHTPARVLSPGEVEAALARMTSKHAQEEWNGLRLWTGRYRLYAIPTDLANLPPGVVTITLSSELSHALVLAPAGAPAGDTATPLTGRQRDAFTQALP